MFFYSVFILWFISRRLFILFTVLWILLIVYLNSIYPGVRGFWNFIGSYYNIEFVMGLSTALIFKNVTYSKKVLAVMLIVFVAMFLILNPTDPFFAHILAGVLCAIIILLSVESFLDHLLDSNIFMIIGNASYSIYLIHNPMLSALFKVSSKFEIHYILFCVLAFSVCVIVGVFYSRIFEGVLLKKVKNYF